MSTTDEVTLAEKRGTLPIPISARTVGFWTIFAIWIGFAVNGGQFMIGALGIGAGVWAGIIAMLLAYIYLGFYIGGGAYVGSKHGIAGTVAMRTALGIHGSIIPSITMWIATWGWFGVQLGIFAGAMDLMFTKVLGWPSDLRVHIVIWGIVMVYIAVSGFRGIAIFERLAVPALLVVMAMALWVVFTSYDLSKVMSFQGDQKLTWGELFNIYPAAGAALCIAAMDSSRYVRSPKSAFWSVFAGGWPGFGWICGVVGLIAAAAAGTWDVPQIMSNLGLGAIGLLLLMLACLTTNSLNIYWGGIALGNITGMARVTGTIITGLVGIFITLIGIYSWDGFFTFMAFEGAFLVPSSAVFLVEYFVFRRGYINLDALFDKQGEYYFTRGWHIPAIVAIAIGAVYGLAVPLAWMPSFVNFFVTGASYIILRYVYYSVMAPAAKPRTI